MNIFLNTRAHIDLEMRVLTTDQLDSVNGGVKDPEPGQIVVVGCTTPPRGYPPGTLVINPWLGQTEPHPVF
ncbi:hypothetical protein [Bradyrhizobium sp.]|uniref:hypothetical protein n=1 Tax=Bradyrhizobium sp. TaxID=376 RepID=UPI003C5A932C